MGAIPSRFEYLPYLIVVMIVEVAIILAIFHYFHKHERLRRESRTVLQRFSENIQSMFSSHSADLEAANDNGVSNIILHSAGIDEYEKVSTFAVDKACFGTGNYKITTYLLCFTRAASFSFFFSVDLVLNMLSVEPHASNWYYFTTWNAALASGYYLVGFFLSTLGLIYSTEVSDDLGSSSSNSGIDCNSKLSFPPNMKWNQYIQKVAYAFFICYEVAGATAMMVTLVNFSFLDPVFYFLNVSLHFITTMSFLIEICLNAQYVYISHLPYNIAWVSLFITIIIPVVVTNTVPDWPYPFMKTDTSVCFLWFTGLLLLNCAFYSLWYLFHRVKFYLQTHACSNSHNQNNSKYIYKSYLTSALLPPEKYRDEQPSNTNTNNNTLLRTTTDSGEIFM